MKQKPKNYWNEDTCREEAKKYTSKTEFQKSSGGAYNVSLRNNWIDDYYWFKKIQRKPNKYWNYERCYNEAEKYSSKDEFQKGNASAYNSSKRNNWLDDYDWF